MTALHEGKGPGRSGKHDRPWFPRVAEALGLDPIDEIDGVRTPPHRSGWGAPRPKRDSRPRPRTLTRRNPRPASGKLMAGRKNEEKAPRPVAVWVGGTGVRRPGTRTGPDPDRHQPGFIGLPAAPDCPGRSVRGHGDQRDPLPRVTRIRTGTASRST